MKRIDFEMLTQIHDRIQKYQLREGYKDKDDFSVKAVVNPISIRKWSNKTAKEIFGAAKKNDKSALEYIFYKMEPAIHGAFWKRFLGPNGDMRKKRISDGAWEDWLGTAWLTLTGGFRETPGKENNNLKGSIDSFDPAKIDEEKLWPVFSNRYKMMLKNSALDSNFAARTQGMSGAPEEMMNTGMGVMQYEPTWIEGKEDWSSDDETGVSTNGGSYQDETFDKVNNDLSAENFMTKWKQFCQNPELYKPYSEKVNVTPAQVFTEIISNPQADFRKMQEPMGASHNTLRRVMEKALQIMEGYNISHSEFTSGLSRFGNDKLASYMHSGVSSDKELPVEKTPKMDDNSPAVEVEQMAPVKAMSKKPAKSDSFEDKLTKAFEDEKMWTPHKKGLDSANLIALWIENGFPTNEKLAKKFYAGKPTDVDYWMRRAWSVLKKFGITEAELKSLVKEHGKEKITSFIGDDNTDDYFNEA